MNTNQTAKYTYHQAVEFTEYLDFRELAVCQMAKTLTKRGKKRPALKMLKAFEKQHGNRQSICRLREQLNAHEITS